VIEISGANFLHIDKPDFLNRLLLKHEICIKAEMFAGTIDKVYRSTRAKRSF